MTDEPLIHTSKGNLPVASLEYRYWWVDNAERTEFHEQHLLAGEVVRESAHIMGKKPLAVLGLEQGQTG